MAFVVVALAACKGGTDVLGKGGPCAAGETANADPPLCYRVPAGMKQKGDPIRRAGHFQIGFEGEPGVKVSFLARDGALDATWKSLQANAANSKASDVREQVEDGGKTRILTYTTPEAKPRSILSLVRVGKTHTIECEVEAPKGAATDDLVTACKALHQPE